MLLLIGKSFRQSIDASNDAIYWMDRPLPILCLQSIVYVLIHWHCKWIGRSPIFKSFFLYIHLVCTIFALFTTRSLLYQVPYWQACAARTLAPVSPRVRRALQESDFLGAEICAHRSPTRARTRLDHVGQLHHAGDTSRALERSESGRSRNRRSQIGYHGSFSTRQRTEQCWIGRDGDSGLWIDGRWRQFWVWFGWWFELGGQTVIFCRGRATVLL